MTPHDQTGHPTRPRCNARKKNGETCKAYAIPPTSKCHYHGGASLRGIASPSFRHGRYSTALPGGLRELAERAARDPELLNLSEEISVIQSRLHVLLSRADKTANPVTLSAIWGDLQRARARKDGAGFTAAVSRMDAALASVNADSELWAEIERTMHTLSRLVSQEQRRRVDMSALVPVGKATEIVREIVLACRAEITDQATLTRIQARVSAALGEGRMYGPDC